MYWYNPKSRSSEKVEAPSTDEEALAMLCGAPESTEFVKEYGRLREAGAPIEQALVLVGHEFRLRQPAYRLVLR
jgi:hypothetical protein